MALCFSRSKTKTLEYGVQGSAQSGACVPLQPHTVSDHIAVLPAWESSHLSPHRTLAHSVLCTECVFHFSLTVFNFYSSSAHNLTITYSGKPILASLAEGLKHHAPLFCSASIDAILNFFGRLFN